MTVVEFARPEAAIAAAGMTLTEEFSLPGSQSKEQPAQFALRLDHLVDQLIGEWQRAHPWHEADFQALHREAMRQLLGSWPSTQSSEKVAAALQRAWVEGVTPIEEARAVITELRSQGIRIGLCSNAPYPPALMHEQLERLQLAQLFDAVLFSSEIGWRKPDSRVFAEILARLGLPAESVWFVGDELEADIEGARAVGMRALLSPGARPPVDGCEQIAQWRDLPHLIESAEIP
jgi:HAD superfamily hydrolase (TIGR01549 family)